MLTIDIEDQVSGEIRTQRAVMIIGIFDGIIRAPAVHIDGRATVTGTLVAADVHIDGAFTGDVFALRLCLGETSTVQGRIVHAALDLRANAHFEGQSRRYPDPIALYRSLGARVSAARL